MVNIEDFIKRLEILLDYYSLNASSFADKIGVQRSSLSHLLSGRNKPSLDFILKVLDNYPEVDLYWITNGKGVFPKSIKIETASTATLFSEVKPEIVETKIAAEISESKNIIVDEKNNGNKITEKIVVFYTDGTFKEYLSYKN